MVKIKPEKNVLTFNRENIKEDVLKKIGDEQWGIGLYALEKIFRKESDSHGAGFGGEDISFTLYGKEVDFNWNEKRLEVTQFHCKNGEYEREDIDPKVRAYLLRKLGK